jgi:hypothetical protein
MNSASLCSLADGYDNPIPARFLAPIDFLKIPAILGPHVVEEEDVGSPGCQGPQQQQQCTSPLKHLDLN